MFKLLIIAIVLASLNETRASSLNFGKCPEEPVIADFDIAKYVGRWYEIQHILAPFEPNLKCVTATYTQQNATQIQVDNRGIRVESGNEEFIQGHAAVKNINAPNQLLLKFPNIPQGNYNVWETDYTNYTLIYSCRQIIPFVLKNELVWIMSRKPTLEKETVDRLRNLLTQRGVGVVSSLLITDQSC